MLSADILAASSVDMSAVLVSMSASAVVNLLSKLEVSTVIVCPLADVTTPFAPTMFKVSVFKSTTPIPLFPVKSKS